MSADPAPPRAGAPLDRRDFLRESAIGLGGIALSWRFERDARAQQAPSRLPSQAPSHGYSHFPPRARRVIQIFCAGGVSHLDTFDFKPELSRRHGSELTSKGENKGFFGQPGRLMQSPYRFAQHGGCGTFVSSLLPGIAGVVDDLCVVRSMVGRSNNHTPATFQMNSGFALNGFPCMGAWLSYGLGAHGEDLPTFVVLPDPRGMPAGGSINWTAGFLPAQHQGVPLVPGSAAPIHDLSTPAEVPARARAAGRIFRDRLDRMLEARVEGEAGLEARIRSYELAARMQISVPEAVDIDGESASTQCLYGIDRPESAGFGRNCLLARRLLERGVRFVQLWNGGAFGSPRINWDGHENLRENHDAQAATMDRPVAGLIRDLKQRGLLADTLVVWTTEFGRGPSTQGLDSSGRDHHPDAFTCFLAGGGSRAGHVHGSTDEVGYFVAEDPVTIPDFHATLLHLLGIDHQRLTFHHNGTARRLTDVHGEVVTGLLA